MEIQENQGDTGNPWGYKGSRGKRVPGGYKGSRRIQGIQRNTRESEGCSETRKTGGYRRTRGIHENQENT